MSKVITLPSGNTAKLRDPESLLKKDRDTVLEIGSKAENEVMRASYIQDALVAISIIEWSFDLIPPSIRFASLGELSPKDYDALLTECAVAGEYLFPNLAQTQEAEEDPKAIIANSND